MKSKENISIGLTEMETHSAFITIAIAFANSANSLQTNSLGKRGILLIMFFVNHPRHRQLRKKIARWTPCLDITIRNPSR